jgi:hypothetical protein
MVCGITDVSWRLWHSNSSVFPCGKEVNDVPNCGTWESIPIGGSFALQNVASRFILRTEMAYLDLAFLIL